jgi:cellulose biosynthesis protein BcsQ
VTFGEARAAAIGWARLRSRSRPDDEIVLIWDPSARLRIVARFAAGTDRAIEAAAVSQALAADPDLSSFFSGDVLVVGTKKGIDHVFDVAWGIATPIDDTQNTARLLDRRRSKDAWYEPAASPWSVTGGPPIVTFASYKGGFGRSTALAATAVGFANEGLRVLVIDLDLEAPGLWSLLPPQYAGDVLPPPEVGLIDVLLDPDILNKAVYPAGVTNGLDVLAAGAIDTEYLEKLARIDYEALVTAHTADGPLPRALTALRDTNNYDLILLDARAGLHDLTGAAINGTPHLVVLFGRDTDESWAGMELILRRIGADRVGSPGGQQDVVLVFAKAPGEIADRDNDKTFEAAMNRFEERALSIMQDGESYYARQEDVSGDSEDLVESDDRHIPVGILFDRDTLHGNGRIVPADRLGYAELRAVIRERVGLKS